MMLGLGKFPGTMVNLREGADCGEILGSDAQHVLQLLARFVVPADLEQRSSQRDPGRQVRGMAL